MTMGMFYNQGEACTSTARILLHDDVYDTFLERFTAAATALVVGDGLDTLHEFVRSKAVRFRSGRGEVPVWPPKR